MIYDMNYDDYGEVINGQETFKFIAQKLLNDKTVGIGWNDESSTHLDIVFKLSLDYKIGMFQRGIKHDYLFISIIDHTSYAFVPDSIKEGTYIQNKLRIYDETGDKLKELINGIIEQLNKE